MKTFPGSFPGSEFVNLSLEDYAQAYALAVEFIEAEAEAMKEARE
ncbi:MAG TPA: hypothetical protein VM661_09915 [Candidatus Sulfotelmatobacter sp.]|jgi:hypothetical protein|nr:hypothetical protein [Candidatus Sulfotelmatobacter sp.]